MMTYIAFVVKLIGLSTSLYLVHGRPFPLSQLCILHIPHIFTKFINSPYYREIGVSCLIYFFVSSIWTMMHLSTMLYAHWTPLVLGTYWTSLVLFVIHFV